MRSLLGLDYFRNSSRIFIMTAKTIYSENPAKSFFATQYKSIVLKPALKLLNKRGDCPAFWTMPFDPICKEISLNGFYEKELLIGMCKLVENKVGTVLDIG